MPITSPASPPALRATCTPQSLSQSSSNKVAPPLPLETRSSMASKTPCLPGFPPPSLATTSQRPLSVSPNSLTPKPGSTPRLSSQASSLPTPTSEVSSFGPRFGPHPICVFLVPRCAPSISSLTYTGVDPTASYTSLLWGVQQAPQGQHGQVHTDDFPPTCPARSSSHFRTMSSSSRGTDQGYP